MLNKRKIVLNDFKDLSSYNAEDLEIYVALDKKGLRMRQINLEDKDTYKLFEVMTAFQQLRIDGTAKTILVIKKKH